MRLCDSADAVAPDSRAWRLLKSRAGLTMVEMVVGLAIMIVLAASLARSVVGTIDRQRVLAGRENIDALVEAMSVMRSDNQDWPGKLSHLTVPITTADKNICGATYSSGKVSQWAGPYLDRVVTSSGIPIGIGLASDSLVREVISGNDAYLKIQVDSVAPEDAVQLDEEYDNDGLASGTIRWEAYSPALPTGQVKLYVLRPIRGC